MIIPSQGELAVVLAQLDILCKRAALADDLSRVEGYKNRERQFGGDLKTLESIIATTGKDGATFRRGIEHNHQELEGLLKKTLYRRQNVIDLKTELSRKEEVIQNGKKTSRAEKGRAHLVGIEKLRISQEDETCSSKTETDKPGNETMKTEHINTSDARLSSTQGLDEGPPKTSEPQKTEQAKLLDVTSPDQLRTDQTKQESLHSPAPEL